eukprot:Hpha_TRINITY_DN2725_c0_g1::TRINITY_DN2725_c0_g1_i1::g.110494::m.110494/K01114/plc; phospholipase C
MRCRAGSSLLLCLVLLLSCGPPPTHAGNGGREHPVKRLIVLMMENRSFDHMLGWLKAKMPSLDGLTGGENNVNPVTKEKVYVSKNAPDEAVDDPDHSWQGTTKEIYGFAKTLHDKTSQPTMGGFVRAQTDLGQHPSNPLDMFTPETAPIMNAMAMEFTVFDRWFPSIPGPTDPNRAYAMSGTSDGQTTNFNHTLWGQQSYFDFLRVHNKTWRAYYQDDPWAVMYFNDTVNNPLNHANVHQMDQFFKDAKSGDLPQFTWLQPRMNSHKSPPDWQHPDASVMEGERLYKSVYEALRASPVWNETAFLITYDEHGGFYDHAAPPQSGVPCPDGVRDRTGFAFDRLGVRIPTLLLSPWAPKGRIVGAPDGPQATSQYDGTSTIATANKLFGIDTPINPRVSWAGTFDGILSELTEPRTDCPMTFPDLPPSSASFLKKMQGLPLNGHLKIQVEYYCKFNPGHGPDCGRNLTNQLDAGRWLEAQVDIFMRRKAEERAAAGL